MSDKFNSLELMKKMQEIDKALNELQNLKVFLVDNELYNSSSSLQGCINKIYESKKSILSQIALLAEERNLMLSLFFKSNFTEKIDLDVFKY